ncbi:MAG: hypothetical protein WC015_02915 [Methanoregula sp.]
MMILLRVYCMFPCDTVTRIYHGIVFFVLCRVTKKTVRVPGIAFARAESDMPAGDAAGALLRRAR